MTDPAPPPGLPATATGLPTRHVNPPRQARSRRTLDRIVRAALALLETEGPDGITVQAVVARARSSVGSFYARFAGKEELLDHLGERVWQEARERWDGAVAERVWVDLGLPEVMHEAVELLVDAHGSRATFLRALDRAGGRNGFGAFRTHVLAELTELLMRRQTEIAHPRPEVAIPFGLAAVSGAIEASEFGNGDPSTADDLVREGRTLLTAYLAGATPDPPDEEDVDFFDVWG